MEFTFIICTAPYLLSFFPTLSPRRAFVYVWHCNMSHTTGSPCLVTGMCQSEFLKSSLYPHLVSRCLRVITVAITTHPHPFLESFWLESKSLKSESSLGSGKKACKQVHTHKMESQACTKASRDSSLSLFIFTVKPQVMSQCPCFWHEQLKFTRVTKNACFETRATHPSLGQSLPGISSSEKSWLCRVSGRGPFPPCYLRYLFCAKDEAEVNPRSSIKVPILIAQSYHVLPPPKLAFWVAECTFQLS